MLADATWGCMLLHNLHGVHAACRRRRGNAAGAALGSVFLLLLAALCFAGYSAWSLRRQLEGLRDLPTKLQNVEGLLAHAKVVGHVPSVGWLVVFVCLE